MKLWILSLRKSLLANALLFTALACHVTSAEDHAADTANASPQPMDLSNWKLVREDDFDYADEKLDENWEAQNCSNHHILCSRWRENAVVSDGILQLVNRKESRGGQDWTSASIWSKKKFKYGYFECRYRYAEATGTNNSFWLITRGPDPTQGKRFEIDINEGHYPNEVNTNIHNWTDVTTQPDGSKTHPSAHFGIAYGMRPDYSMPLEIPVTTKRLRMTSTSSSKFHIREFRVYGVNDAGYPDALSETADLDVKGLVNHARDPAVKITASGVYNDTTKPQDAADGTWRTSWISPAEGDKWLQFDWPEPVTIGCIQFINGWQKKGEWTGGGQVSAYKIQYHDGVKWKDITTMDSKDAANFGAEYHTYGLLWTEDELVFYRDGQEIRSVKNEFCHSESSILLSGAIIKWAGTVTDEIDGTSMKVDWVRYYQKR